MARLLLAVVLFLAQLAGQRTEAEPQLEFSAQLNADGSRLKLIWSNRGERPFLITVGSLLGGSGLGPRADMWISGPGIMAGNLIDTSLPAAVGGRIEFLVVCLSPRAGYSYEFPTEKLWLPGFTKTLKDASGQRWALTVSYVGIRAFRDTPEGKRIPYDVVREFPADFPFWTGTAKTEIGR